MTADSKPPYKGLSNRVCFMVNLRDRLTCQQCGKRPQSAENYHRGFQYHHRLPRSQGGPDVVENVLLLCHTCHQVQHHEPGVTRGEPLPPLPVPESFACLNCQAQQQTETVEMNCGWYRCQRCEQQIHLFDHVFSSPEAISAE
jgi:hypothetical protein